MTEPSINGELVKCARCNGHGLIARWQDGEPDDCPECDGSGLNWKYRGGAVARHYGGPFLSGPSSSHKETKP